MLMSFSPIQANPQKALFTSTPNKGFGTPAARNTNAHTPPFNGFPKTEPSSSRPKSCPTSPVISYPERNSVPEAEESTVSSVMETDAGETMPSPKAPELLRTGHKSIKNEPQCGKEREQLKQRLLEALSELIPHKDRLSLRLLVNYTIDDEKTDCIVIDETLCRSNPPALPRIADVNLSDSGCVLDQFTPVKRRRLSKDANALDLTVHSDRDEQEMDEAMTAELEEENLRPNGPQANSTTSQTLTDNQLIPNGHVPSLSSTVGLPFLDSSVLTLLPLLQQQQQHQMSQSDQMNVTGHNNDISSTQPTVSSTNVETAESILFKELQALIRANNGNNESLTAKPTPTNSNQQQPNNTNPFLSQNHTNLLNPSPLVGFPLLNAIQTDQFNAIQSLLPSYPLVASSTNGSANFASLNVSPATLLNLKNLSTGLETVGILPCNSTARTNTTNVTTNPVANLLGQLSIQQSNNFPLRTLSNLTHLFNPNDSNKAAHLMNPSPSVISASINGGVNFGDAILSNQNDRRSGAMDLGDMQPQALPDPSLKTTGKLAESYFKSETTSNGVSNGNGNYSSHNSSQFLFGRRPAHTRRFICNQCRGNFSSLAELNRHTLEAHNSFKCTICSAHFTQRSNLQRHSLKHVGFKPFTCNLCKKEYYRKDHLVRHIEVTHPNHDPKMNITVHLTSSECLDYLDRLQSEKQSPSSEEAGLPDGGTLEQSELEEPQIDECVDHVLQDEPSEQTEEPEGTVEMSNTEDPPADEQA